MGFELEANHCELAIQSFSDALHASLCAHDELRSACVTVNFVNLIESKRDGLALQESDIQAIVTAAATDQIPDYQLAAFLMAVFFRGMSADECATLTVAMRDSGRVLEWPEDERPVVDKHSTGGVGDKVSLVLAPVLACLGFRVPMISGRGLGITGGTLDKLESIPGFQTCLEPEQIIAQVQKIGCAIVGQTDDMVPADRKLYSLRDVTATVPSVPLITASILSKKLSEGLKALVMDIKFGAAAFMKTRDEARTLAQAIVDLAGQCQLPTKAFLTGMDAPLGATAGNWLEVKEAARCLRGYGPDDLQGLVVEFAAALLVQTGRFKGLPKAKQRVLEVLSTDEPSRRFEALIKAQGGNLEEFKALLAKDTLAPVVREFVLPDEGFVSRVDARIIGEIVRDLGGGRLRNDSAIDHTVGLDCLAKPGEPFGVNSLFARVHARTEAEAERALEKLKDAFSFQSDSFEVPPLVVEVLG
jgi:pyrimidine-nucleoside phosphorylase